MLEKTTAICRAALRGDRRRGAQQPDRRGGQATQAGARAATAPSRGEAARGSGRPGGRRRGRRDRRSINARGRQPHISYFAFTATPKFKTLDIFGTPGPDGKPQPFHLYSMRQAIEEGFILDVLQNYITYKTYFRLERPGRTTPRWTRQGRQGHRPLRQPAPPQHRPEDRGDRRALPPAHAAGRSGAGLRPWSSPARGCTLSAISVPSTPT